MVLKHVCSVFGLMAVTFSFSPWLVLYPGSEDVMQTPRPCGKAEFTCSNHRCIPQQLQCDLFDDCGDGGSDEQDCKGGTWLLKSPALPLSLYLSFFQKYPSLDIDLALCICLRLSTSLYIDVSLSLCLSVSAHFSSGSVNCSTPKKDCIRKEQRKEGRISLTKSSK